MGDAAGHAGGFPAGAGAVAEEDLVLPRRRLPGEDVDRAAALAAPRRVLTTRAETWACDRVTEIEGTSASLARGFGVSWSTVWAAVELVGRQRVEDPDRLGPTLMVGFDETLMQPAHRRRRRRFVTAVVDVGSGQILDVFEGRDAAQLRAWMATIPLSWLAHVQVVSVDPHEGYRSAVVNPDRRPSASAVSRPAAPIIHSRAARQLESVPTCS